jgi:hypothetical protein
MHQWREVEFVEVIHLQWLGLSMPQQMKQHQFGV